jgi:hypothetical protein
MKLRGTLICLVLVAFLAPLAAFSQENEDERTMVNYNLWFGGHYTDFDGYRKRVGRYDLGETGLFPETILQMGLSKKNSYLALDARYYDKKNQYYEMNATQGSRVDLSLQFHTMVRQGEWDLLDNLEAREWLGTNPGGKMVTHELLDLAADPHLDRQEVKAKGKFVLSKRGNIRLSVAHRSIFERGTEQIRAISHCFSCHITAQEVRVERETHEVTSGLEAEVGGFDVAYFFGYRKFESDAATPENYYDEAKHPVNGGAGAEFQSRLIYQNEILSVGSYPTTEKFSHTGRVSGGLWRGRLSGSIGYSEAENTKTDVKSDAVTGMLTYALPVTKRARLVGKLNGVNISSDPVYIQLPIWREGRPDDNPVDFSYTRYSALNRTEGEASLELVARLKGATSLSLLGGYETIDRTDYPSPQTAYRTDKLTAQGTLRLRNGGKYNGRIKYRYEFTDRPFRTQRGIFEYSGRYTLERTTPVWAFYYQREELRHGNVTPIPTNYHEIELKAMGRPQEMVSFDMGLRSGYGENNDIDSVGTSNYFVQPNLYVGVKPTDQLSFDVGYTYNHMKSTGPITIPLFDG